MAIWAYSGFEGIDLNDNGKIGEDVSGGIDPNRNYDYGFGNPIFSSLLPESEVFCGAFPFSERCTNNLKNFIENHRFKTAVSLHSGIQAIYYPRISQNNNKNELDFQNYVNVKSSLEGILGFNPPSMMNEAGLFAPWMYWENEVNRIAICLETYGNASALTTEYNESTELYEEWGVWDFFNPSENKVIENSELIYNGLLFLAEHNNPEDKKKISSYDPFYFIIFFIGSIYIIIKNKK